MAQNADYFDFWKDLGSDNVCSENKIFEFSQTWKPHGFVILETETTSIVFAHRASVDHFNRLFKLM